MMSVALCGCARTSAPAPQGGRPPFVYSDRLGLATWRDTRGCLALFNASVTPQTRVALVEQPASGGAAPTVTDASVVASLPEACDRGLAGANAEGIVPSFYEVAIAHGTTPPAGVVFAILDPADSLGVRDGHVESDLDGDGARELFRTCTSTENMHFMVWTGAPPERRPRWHGHYDVGYDMTPSCTADDVAGIVALDRPAASAK